MANLSGLHLVITRPTEQALRWQKKLNALGANTQLIPVLDIKPSSKPEQEQAIKNKILALDQFQHLIFVSQNAVQYGIPWIEQYWPQLPINQNYYAIGSATASALQNCKLTVDADTQAMDSEALLALAKLQSVAGSKVLIFRGIGGRTKIAEVLVQRGADLSYCELYERAMPINLCEQLQQFAANYLASEWLFSVHSGESLDNLLIAAKKINFEKLFSLPLLVPSARISEIAKKSGFKKLIVAGNASDEAMTEALVNWQFTNEAPTA